MAAPATECPALACVPRATPAPCVRTGVLKKHTASGVSTAACVRTGARVSTTPELACVPQGMLGPSVKQVSVAGVPSLAFLYLFDVYLSIGFHECRPYLKVITSHTCRLQPDPCLPILPTLPRPLPLVPLQLGNRDPVSMASNFISNDIDL